MTRSVRYTVAAVAFTAVVAYVGLVWLTAALGGPWQLVAACIAGLCVLSFGALLGLAYLAKESGEDPTDDPGVRITRPEGGQ